MPSEPIALPILDPADVLTAAYDQLVRYRAYIEAAREITRGASTPRPASNARSNATYRENSATALAAATAIADAHPELPDSAPNNTSTFLLNSPSSAPSPFCEHDLLLPVPYTLRLTPLTLTLHAFLPVFYAERPLLGIDTHSLVILARDLPSLHHPPSPCAFASIHLSVPIDPTRCTAAFHHGSLGIRLLRATCAASASPTPTV